MTQYSQKGLTDAEWQLLEPMISPSETAEFRSIGIRRLVSAMFYKMRTGCEWEELPQNMPSYQMVYYCFLRWQKSGFWDKLNDRLKERSQVTAIAKTELNQGAKLNRLTKPVPSLNIKVLEESFALIKSHEERFAVSFYENLFTDYPQLRRLFINTSMKDQEKKLMKSLVLVIYNLRNLTYLKSVLRDLGIRHIRYHTKVEHYPMVGAALLKTFESFLGPNWTPEVKQAWADAYTIVVDLMLENG
jgi:hemoglobin-like flavoprotein/transposase